MQKMIKNLIEEYRRGNEAALVEIIEKMRPLINKYARKLFRMEFEDMQQEMVIAVIVAVEKIESIETEYKCLAYIVNAVNNRYYELCRKSLVLENHEELWADEKMCGFIIERNNLYLDVEFNLDLVNMVLLDTPLKVEIFRYITERQLGDMEIAEKLKISRQYVNKCKKRFLINLGINNWSLKELL